MVSTPEIVLSAFGRAKNARFTLSSEEGVGRLLAVLAAQVRSGGRILEIGTGAGVGTSWLVSGLLGRTDVELITVEFNSSIAAVARDYDWPSWVSFREGDVLEMYDQLGQFDLIFADAQGGKWEGLDLTISALNPGGVLLVDDMTPPEWVSDNHELKTQQVRETLLSHPELISCELSIAYGAIISTRLRK